MKYFEISENNNEVLKDANYRTISSVFVPDQAMCTSLDCSISEVQEDDTTFFVIRNTEQTNPEETFNEGLKAGNFETYTYLVQLMTELIGSCDYLPEEHGISLGNCLDILNARCFAQMTALTIGNIESCLEEGGYIIAFFPRELWECYYKESYTPEIEINGLKAIRIIQTVEGNILFKDVSGEKGLQCMDRSEFQWLSQKGWMLEVYK